jgi:tetratricopeptide (TPR) repeat protein
MVRCGSSPDSPALTGTTSQSGTAALEALKEIDSLMWKQPDSALTVMLKFAASPEADSLDEFEGYYCQMLISELLYKNYYEQSNREELLKAVDYFDSIVAVDEYKTDSRRDAPRASAKNAQNIAFLDARAHYINGVGYYERADVVNACEEYLNALEMVEAHFEEKELIGEMAVFMNIVYSRLLELFSIQFMMDPAIACGEQALAYCQKEPMLSQNIPIIYYHIGKQYDKKGDKDVAINYYSKAIEGISNPQNVVYRNIISTKALCDYQVGLGTEQTLNEIKQLLVLSDNNNELLTRYLTIGGIYYEEGIYDSALRYLEPVFENKDDQISQILSANYLRFIYDSIGDQAKSNECTRFLADYKKPEGENKALVSKLEDMFKNYQNQKQEKEAEAERERSIKKTIKIIVPVAVVVVITIIILAKLKSKKLLKEQQEEADRMLGETEQEHENELRRLQAEAEQQLADAEQKHQQKVEEIVKRHEDELKLQKDKSEKEIEKTKKRHEEELEAERSAYQKEREELERSLRQSKENVNALQKELGRKRTGAAEHYAAFLEESVCAKINGLVRDLHITTRKPYSHYHISLDDDTIAQLSEVVTVHYGELKPTLQCLYPGISHEDLLLCYLYLLGLSNKQIAVLRQRDYSTVRKQAKELMGKLRIDETVRDYVLDVAGVEEFVEK